MFKWAVAEELVSESTYRALMAVAGLQRGRCDAEEPDPALPVPDALVDTVLPFLLTPVRAMIELQRVTGMRPGEVCAMCASDLDTTGAVWLYRPNQHKTAWRGKSRVIAIGPRGRGDCQTILDVEHSKRICSARFLALAERAAALGRTQNQSATESEESAEAESKAGAAGTVHGDSLRTCHPPRLRIRQPGNAATP